MKILYRILSISLISIFCVSCAFTGKKLDPISSINADDAEKGTLANDLADNISLAIGQIMGAPDKEIEMFVVQQPVVRVSHSSSTALMFSF